MSIDSPIARTSLTVLVLLGLTGCGARTDTSLVAAEEDASVSGSSHDASVADAPTDTGIAVADTGAAPDAGSAPPDSAAPPLLRATATPVCGPTDGVATSFLFSADGLVCGTGVPGVATYDNIVIYTAPTAPMTYSFTPSGPNGEGYGESCEPAGCINALTVTLTVESYSAATGAMTGTYSITLQGGSTVAGAFDGVVCAGLLMCG